MHPDTPEGLAIKDRTLALWRDLRQQTYIRKQVITPRPSVNKTGYTARWSALVNHYIDGIDVFLNGRVR